MVIWEAPLGTMGELVLRSSFPSAPPPRSVGRRTVRETLHQLSLALAPDHGCWRLIVRGDLAGAQASQTAKAYRPEIAMLALPHAQPLRAPREAGDWRRAQRQAEEPSVRSRRPLLPSPAAALPGDLSDRVDAGSDRDAAALPPAGRRSPRPRLASMAAARRDPPNAPTSPIVAVRAAPTPEQDVAAHDDDDRESAAAASDTGAEAAKGAHRCRADGRARAECERARRARCRSRRAAGFAPGTWSSVKPAADESETLRGGVGFANPYGWQARAL
jgi:hypothetical protein